MNSAPTSTVSLLSTSSKKDYAAAFADLQSRYGLGVNSLPAPPNSPSQTASSVLPTTRNQKKWFNWLSTRRGGL